MPSNISLPAGLQFETHRDTEWGIMLIDGEGRSRHPGYGAKIGFLNGLMYAFDASGIAVPIDAEFGLFVQCRDEAGNPYDAIAVQPTLAPVKGTIPVRDLLPGQEIQIVRAAIRS